MTKPLSRFACVLLIAVAGDPPTGAAQENPGKGVRVIDGDTFEIDGQVVQLFGIDAPELGQMCDRGGDLWECGRESALYLQKLLSFEGPPVQCSPWEGEAGLEIGPEIVVGTCQIGSKEVGLTMVSNGYAVALAESFPDYQKAETQAREAGLGLWQSEFVPPSEWREGRGDQIKSSDWVRQCVIKGVLGPAGERTYYVPTDQEYAEASVDPEGDGRMFCSDEEARAAGWTRSTGSSK